MRILMIFLLMFSALQSAMAQKRGVIVNMETGVPIRDAKIYTNTNKTFTTDWRGQYSIKDYFTSATITHQNYLSLTLNLYEMGDTIELLPRFNTLEEVVVYGSKPMTFDVKRATRDARDYYTPNVGGFSFDFFSLFHKRRGLSSKEKEKHDEIIRTY